MPSNKDVNASGFGLVGALTGIASLAVTGTLLAGGAVQGTSFVNTDLPGTQTGAIICVVGATGELGYCNGNGTGSGTKTCSVCSAF
jgi:hypothetical protein